MNRPDFFPDVAFGWAFYAALVALLTVASIIDFRSFRIPNTLTVACLVLGLIFNLARGLWLGLQDKIVWKLNAGPVLGALDGFLFSLAGFATTFGLFFCLWFLKGCGGGDVKLFAAVGTWVGPWFGLILVIFSAIVLIIIATVWMACSMLFSGFGKTRKSFSAKEIKLAKRGDMRPKHRGMTYSFPLAFATAVTLVALLWRDLGLSQGQEAPQVPQPVSLVR